MKQAASRIGSLLLPAGAALAVLALLLWSGGGSEQIASAYPGLTVAIDMDPSTTTDVNGDGIYETVDVNTFESCVDVTSGQQFPVVVSVLDVSDLTAFLAQLEYDGSVVKVIKSYTGVTENDPPTMFLSAQPNSEVLNTSENIFDPSTGLLSPADTDGSYEAQAFDSSHTDNGDDGSGILVQLTLEAITPGVSVFNIDRRDLDVPPDGLPDRGVTLTDVNAVYLGDINADGFFDGPFINANSTISVDQPDQDNDGTSDACDPDKDGDGILEDGDDSGIAGDNPCTGGATTNCDDNCPDIFNPTQSDIDGDGEGDYCDGWDADSDGYINAAEIAVASDTFDPLSVPEVCDGLDNDGDTLTDEGPGDPPTPFADIDGDTVPDCVDTDTNGNLIAVDTDGDTVPNMNDTDDDDDGTTDANENVIGTDSLSDCHDNSGLPDWPQDLDNNRLINILDVVKMTPPVFGTSMPDEPYERRKDLQPDAIINILDIFKMTPPVFGTSCTP